jgi:hypothetical protein
MRTGSGVVMQYVKSILNPSLVGGKVPDDFVQPSAAFQLEQEFIVAPKGTQVCMVLELGTLPSFGWYGNAAGNAAVMNTASPPAVVTPAVIVSGEATKIASSGASFDDGPTATPGTAGGGQVMKYIGQSTDLKTLLGLYKSCRLVSAGIKVQYSGTDSQNQGVISIGYLNREWFSHQEETSSVNNITSSATASKCYVTASSDNAGTTNNYWHLKTSDTLDMLGQKIRSLPINAYGPAKDGCFGRYFPLDANDTEFRQLATDAQVTSAVLDIPLYQKSNHYVYGTQGATGGNNWASNNMNYGAFIIVGESMSAGSSSFVVKVVCNYEGAVRDEAMNLVSTKASPVAAGAMAKASSIYGKSWQCKVGGEVTTRAV